MDGVTSRSRAYRCHVIRRAQSPSSEPIDDRDEYRRRAEEADTLPSRATMFTAAFAVSRRYAASQPNQTIGAGIANGTPRIQSSVLEGTRRAHRTGSPSAFAGFSLHIISRSRFEN